MSPRPTHRERPIEAFDPSVKLNAEILRLVLDYAESTGFSADTVVNAALRDWFGADQ